MLNINQIVQKNCRTDYINVRDFDISNYEVLNLKKYMV